MEKDGKIDFAELPVIEPRMREILLKWLSDGLEDMEYVSRTEEGRKYKIEVPQKGENVSYIVKTAILQCHGLLSPLRRKRYERT